MPSVLHTVADAVLKQIQRSPLYYKRYNNTLAYRINKTYTAYGQDCERQYAQTHTSLPPSPLAEDPALHIPAVFPSEKAEALSAKIGKLIDRNDSCVFRPPREHGGGIAQIKQPLRILGTDILDTLYNSELDQALRRVLRGYYRIQGTAIWRTFPTEHADRSSWLWHSDTYPPYTCKIFVHLTPVDPTSGATEFMNRSDTMAYRKAGYFGQYGQERRGDLDVFSKEHGLPYRTVQVSAQPGDATLFDQNYLHRAVPPHKNYRDIVQFLIVANPIPWHEQLERETERVLSAECDYPKDPRPGATTTSVKMH
jgi:hypothetical protein